ncbi:exported hypothetical protein [Xenorhabdus nematophila F1]|uniref:Uncharacterized protein n=2 Tax=Xenorhabdus bovienii TaxID=40576 RepID=A0A077PR92_XENBV|nr:exported hypothetical protein [Xenorhabdus nematophila F1]CDH00414.1 exported hypothetical protein [Xenorhabdus bovienii str. feltiae Moldova]CDH22409.1 exported hypothetical protein [Xenorhabdus bovienii str. kraussei Becker Underwood]
MIYLTVILLLAAIVLGMAVVITASMFKKYIKVRREDLFQL